MPSARIPRRSGSALVALAVLFGLVGLPVTAELATAAPPAVDCADGVRCTTIFEFTGAAQQWTAPTGTDAIKATVSVSGAQGGVSVDQVHGGLGATVTATIPVVPGQTYQIQVGGTALDQQGGYFGGGNATDCPRNDRASGGGGASQFGATGGATTLIAGGGGGAGGHAYGSDGGTGGNGAASSAHGGRGHGGERETLGGYGGGGASGITPGDGAPSVDVAHKSGKDGTLGQGGDGGSGRGCDDLHPGGGGGGGGGALGGGGGGDGEGGFRDGIIPEPYRGGGGGGGGGGSSRTGDAATGVKVTDGVRAGNGAVVITYERIAQVITFTSTPPDAAVLNGSYAPAATASSGLPVSIVVSGSCSFGGTDVSFIHAGTCTVTASQAGDRDHLAATQTQVITVPRAPQTIAFGSDPPQQPSIGDTYSVSLRATGLRTIIVTATGSCTIVSGWVVTFTAPGTCTVQAYQVGDRDYLPSPRITRTIDVPVKAPRPVVGWGRTDLGIGDVPASLDTAGATAIDAGEAFGLALTPAGTVVAWGDSYTRAATVPASLTGRTVTAISAGNLHGLALTANGQVTAWGDNSTGQATVPASLAGKTVTAISAGGGHNLALTSDGQVTAWGNNFVGQGTVPASLAGQTVTAISAGRDHSVALTSGGQITAWGYNHYGQATVPASLTDKTVTAISAGGVHSLALTSDAQLTAWGDNTYGLDTVPLILKGRPITQIAAGGYLNVALAPVVAAPRVAASPTSVLVDLGSSASFTATATGSPTPTVQWQRADAGSLTFTDIPAAASTTYTFTAAAVDDSAKFRAVFTSSAGTATTDPAWLSVNSPPSATDLDVTAGFESATAVALAGTDPEEESLTYEVITQPTHGSLSGTAPQLTYTPEDGYVGPDAFTYRVNDRRLDSAVATVTLTVSAQTCVPAAPVRNLLLNADERDTNGIVRTPKLSIRDADELLVAFVAVNGPVTRAQSVVKVSGGGQTWTLVQRDNTERGTSEIWQAYATKKVRSTPVVAHLAASGYSVSMTVAGFSGARPDVGAVAHQSGRYSAPRVSLSPQSSGSVIWAVGRVIGSRYVPKPVGRQEIVHQATFTSPSTGYWLQSVAASSTYGRNVTVRDTATAQTWGYTAVEIRGICR